MHLLIITPEVPTVPTYDSEEKYADMRSLSHLRSLVLRASVAGVGNAQPRFPDYETGEMTSSLPRYKFQEAKRTRTVSNFVSENYLSNV